MREALHELKKQLAVILSFTTFVSEETPAGDPRREDLEEIPRAAKRAPDVSVGLVAAPAAED